MTTIKALLRFLTVLSIIALTMIAGCPAGEDNSGDQAPASRPGTEPATAAQPGAGGIQRGVSGRGQEPSAPAGETPAQPSAGLPGTAAVGGTSRWWGEGSDPYRQFCTTHTGPATPKLRWSCDVGQAFMGRLVIAGGDVIVASLTTAASRPDWLPVEDRLNWYEEDLPDPVPDGAVAGISTAGEVSWRYKTEGEPLLFAANIPEPRIYAQTYWHRGEDVRLRGDVPDTLALLYGALVALDPAGTELWKTETGGAMLGEPLVTADGSIYGTVVTREFVYHHKYVDDSVIKANLVCYEPEGEERWRYWLSQFDECRWLKPACQLVLLRDGNLGMGWNGFTFHSVKPDGGKSWKYGFQSQPDSAVAVSPSGDIVFLSNDRPQLDDKQLELMNWEAMNKYGVLQVLKNSGSLRWNLQAGSDVHSAPVIDADGTIYFGATLFEHRREDLNETGRVYALQADKKLKWQYDTRAGFGTTPKQPDPLVDAAGVLYIADCGRHLYAINPDGSLKWEYEAPKGFATNAVIGADGTLYIGGNDHKLYALGEGG